MRHLASALVAAALLNLTPTSALDTAHGRRTVEAAPTDRLDIEGNKPVFADADAAGGSAVFITADYGAPEGPGAQVPPNA